MRSLLILSTAAPLILKDRSTRLGAGPRVLGVLELSIVDQLVSWGDVSGANCRTSQT